MAGEDFFKFNKDNEFRFSNFREIKEEDLKDADEKTKKLFNIFAGKDKILQEVEAKSLFNVLKSAAGNNQVLEDNEIKAFAKEYIGEEVDTNILATFVNNIFWNNEKPQTQAVQVVNGFAAQKQQTFLEEAACKEIVIDIIDENLSEAYEILNSQYLGSISGWHDERKDKNDILKTSNVSKVLEYQNAGIEWMNKAKLTPPNGLTKKEYYEGNKQRIKDMILTRVLVLDTNTKFKELKNKYSEEKLAEIIGDYVEQLCSNASIEDLKDIQKQFVSYSGVEEIHALENVIDNAIKFNADKNKPMSYGERPLSKIDNFKGIVPEYWNTDEPISFEEVYKIERGTEYSQYKIEQYALAKKEMEVVANAYNKKQQFIEFAEGLRKDETLNIDEKTQKVLEGFATFYALAEDGGLSQLQELITESKLPISIDENGFNFGTLDDSAKNRALNSLLKLAQQSKEKEFEEFLNGKTIEDYQIALAQAHDDAIGEENGKLMAEAMKNDNLTCIQRWTGNTSMAGMGMTVVGGILCFTPLAPLGAGMVTVGNTLAIGGMVAETGLGVADYATKDVQTAEEAEQLGKNFLMNAGGFIIGMGAGKAGMKAFSNLIDEKLVAVFGQQIAAGNKMQALKTVFTNPEYLKNFMTAAGAKLSADFVISYAGDLAMMGILDTQDDWQSLLKANLTGILVGMSGDIKDVSGVGRPRNFGISDGVKPMTEMDYGQRLLGNDVTVADPKTGTTVEGTVTGLYSQDGQVEIEVNGQRYSTNDVAEVKGEAKVEVETPKVEISLGQRLETASSREEFVAIRDEIKSMPNGAEKTALQQEYLKKYNEFSRKYNEQFDIRMEYKPETKNVTTDIYNLKSIEGSIDENTEVLVKTKNNIQSLLGESVKNPVYIEEFLNSIPNEYCAKVLETYIQKHSDNLDSNMLSGLGKVESVQGFVKLLENVNHEIRPSKITLIKALGFDKYLELQENGYLPPKRRGLISEELQYIDEIQDPDEKHLLHKLYASKIFSGSQFYELFLPRNKEIDLNKLDRLDSMCDELGFLDEMTMEDCERLLDLSEEQLDIIEKRNLLKKIPDRKHKLSGRDVLELLEVDDKTWDIIQRRNLLADILQRDNAWEKPLSVEDIAICAKLSDTEWEKLKNTDLLYRKISNEQNEKHISYLTMKNAIAIMRMDAEQKSLFDNFMNEVHDLNSKPLFKIEECISLVTEYTEIGKIFLNDKDFPQGYKRAIVSRLNSSNEDLAIQLCKNYKKLELPVDRISSILDDVNEISIQKLQKLRHIMGNQQVTNLSNGDFIIACRFVDIYNKTNINEIPVAAKKDLLRSLVRSNQGLFCISEEMKKMFPLIPTDQESYCTLLPSLVRSMGIETNVLTSNQISTFNKSLSRLSDSLAKLSDNEFANLNITQDYSKESFIQNVLKIVKDMPVEERQKVYDYFGFELHHNQNNQTGFSITGYPVNLNNGKKLAQITDPRTKEIVELLRPEVIKFSEQNPIRCNNPQIEQLLNDVVDVLPELRAQIGKTQHSTHDFNVLQHSLKVMQKISQEPKFQKLSNSDQKVMMLASLLHDITKREGSIDKTHANESSFDTFFIARKFKLTREEEIKLYTLAKHHEWLEYVNTSKSEEQLTKRLQSVAYDLQNDNLFDMALMFTHADLRAVKADDTFHDTTIGKGRITFDGTVRSYGESADVYAKRIQHYIQELQKSQPLLPVTKIPTASKIAEAITIVKPDGSTNIKGVYKDKDGLIVIKYNEVEDWEAIGFPEGSISRGIEAQKGVNYGDAELEDNVNTGNIKFFVHGLDYENQLAKFDAFGLVDSDVLLSISYAERPETKYRFFRTQGVILDFDTKYIHGGGNHDSGSGCGKSIEDFKKNYIFGGQRESERLYVSDLIKKATGMNDDQYVDFIKKYENKSLSEIEPKDLRETIIKAFASINSNTRKGNRSYNEMYGSNPKEVMAVFAYNTDYNENFGNPVEFLNRGNQEKYTIGTNTNLSSVYGRTEFLRRYALEHDVPFVIFGD